MMRSIYACLLLVFLSCNKNETAEYRNLIQGLATPIRLGYGSTDVWLADFFSDVTKIQSVMLEGRELAFDNTTGIVAIEENIQNPVANLEVVCDGVHHDIPVFASQKLEHHFSYRATNVAAKKVQLAGNMNGWNPSATILENKSGNWETTFILNPGLYEYQVVEDGKWMLDQNNPNTKDNGQGGLNSVFEVGDYNLPAPAIRLASTQGDTLLIETESDSVSLLAYFENTLLETVASGKSFKVKIPFAARNLERSHLRVYGHNGRKRTNDLLAPLSHGIIVTDTKDLNRNDLQTAIMYFMMVDRFADGVAGNNRPTLNDSILPKANNLGGDIAGITAKIDEHYFSRLGVNTLWLSPITTNVEGAWGLWKDKNCIEEKSGNCVHSKFSAYHGYWPVSMRTIDNRFGNADEFRALLDNAHSNQMNVLVDYVAHHVHEQHPLYRMHPEWATQLHLPDGRLNTELWDEQRLTTWFDVFLPTWDFANPEVTAALSDTAMFWVTDFDIDGFRHDATKHIPVEFWRALTRKVKAEESRTGKQIFQIGETYGNPELISSYISNGQLDAQFDFNLYDAAVDAFAKDETGFRNLDRVLETSLGYYGHHHLMGNITGNQDRARFISYADGSVAFSEDAKRAGWTREIINRDATGFNKLQMLTAFLMTTPGIPCIYYGDEIGMPGGNDPDNRRMMQFEDLDTLQQRTFDNASALAKLRSANMALTYGDMNMILADDHIMAFTRSYFGKTAIIIFYKGAEEIIVNVPLPSGLNVNGLKPLNGTAQWQAANGMFDARMKGNSWEVWTN